MRLSRHRCRRRRARLYGAGAARSAGRLLLPVALLTLAAEPLQPGATLARLAAGSGSRPAYIEALGSAALGLSARAVDLGTLQTGQDLGQRHVLVVYNRSDRVLPLAAGVIGAPGLAVRVEPALLPPGGSAVVDLTGEAPAAAGAVRGDLCVSAFGGFLSVSVPIEGEVQAPPDPAPADAATEPPNPAPADAATAPPGQHQ